MRCPQLTSDNLCMLFNHPSRPDICCRLKPSEEMCGLTAAHANLYLANLEEATKPA